MSQNLTQPEEIDCILMAMAGRDEQDGAQIPHEQSGEVACGLGCGSRAGASAFSRGVVQYKKSAYGLSDP